MRALQIKGTKVYCFDPKYRKLMLMGNKVGNTFFKSVEQKHYMVIVGGYGFQYDAFIDFEKEGIEKIQILERHTGHTWESKPSEWIANGKIADYGRGKQIFLSMKFMRMVDKKKQKEEAEKKEAERTRINQERLFGK